MNPQDFPAQLTGFQGWSRTMAWSPDGQLIAAGCLNGGIKVWNPHTTAVPQNRQVVKGQGYQEIADCLWLEDGKRLAYKAGDSGLEIYDFEQNIKWRRMRDPKMSLRGAVGLIR
jgi:WD40 repeat protein